MKLMFLTLSPSIKRLPVFVTEILRHGDSVIQIQHAMPPSTGDEHNISRFLYTFERKITFLRHGKKQIKM